MEHPDYVSGNYTTKFMEDFVLKDVEDDEDE
jgi:acetyl-CoA carboxylase biotin carboxylase subunit